MRIGFTGSASTGKSSLLERIEGLPKITEIARTLIKEYGELPHEMDNEKRFYFQLDLLHEQINKEYELEKFISDRTTIDILAYFQDIENITDEQIKTYCVGKYDIIFYFPIEFPLEKDGIRKEDEEYRKLIDKRIIKILRTLDLYDKNLEMYTLSGSIEERLFQYNKHVNNLQNRIK